MQEHPNREGGREAGREAVREWVMDKAVGGGMTSSMPSTLHPDPKKKAKSSHLLVGRRK